MILVPNQQPHPHPITSEFPLSVRGGKLGARRESIPFRDHAAKQRGTRIVPRLNSPALGNCFALADSL